jgi:hypothetical protein
VVADFTARPGLSRVAGPGRDVEELGCRWRWFRAIVHRSGFDARGVSDPVGRVERMYEEMVRLRGQLSELVAALDPDALHPGLEAGVRVGQAIVGAEVPGADHGPAG